MCDDEGVEAGEEERETLKMDEDDDEAVDGLSGGKGGEGV